MFIVSIVICTSAENFCAPCDNVFEIICTRNKGMTVHDYRIVKGTDLFSQEIDCFTIT